MNLNSAEINLPQDGKTEVVIPADGKTEVVIPEDGVTEVVLPLEGLKKATKQHDAEYYKRNYKKYQQKYQKSSISVFSLAFSASSRRSFAE